MLLLLAISHGTTASYNMVQFMCLFQHEMLYLKRVKVRHLPPSRVPCIPVPPFRACHLGISLNNTSVPTNIPKKLTTKSTGRNTQHEPPFRFTAPCRACYAEEEPSHAIPHALQFGFCRSMAASLLAGRVDRRRRRRMGESVRWHR
jgi:hypothetical protein